MLKVTILIIAGAFLLNAEDSYFSKLTNLTNGRDKLSEKQRDSIIKSEKMLITEGLAGVRFGMSMQDVVNIWGVPNNIWMQSDNLTQLSICNSTFEFKNDVLCTISIHSVDLPKFSIMDGAIKMDQKSPDLLKVFPGEKIIGDDNSCAVELENELTVSILEMDLKIIAITISKPY